MGGKRRLADAILSRIPEHSCYVEVFAGGAAILFAKEDPAEVEVLNDIDGELVNFYRVLKHHLLEFCNQFRYSIVSRQIFDWLSITPTETLTDIQRAARFYYLQKLCFGGRPTGRTFGTATTSRPRLNLLRIEEEISEAHVRLAHVFVEHLDWPECIKRYDRPHTFFFLDPPYWKLSGYGTSEFGLEEYQKLADAMGSCKGRTLLTINDHPDIRKIFTGFKYERLEITYIVGGVKSGRKKATELLYRSWR